VDDASRGKALVERAQTPCQPTSSKRLKRIVLSASRCAAAGGVDAVVRRKILVDPSGEGDGRAWPQQSHSSTTKAASARQLLPAITQRMKPLLVGEF
jgi:hypothetical protein